MKNTLMLAIFGVALYAFMPSVGYCLTELPDSYITTIYGGTDPCTGTNLTCVGCTLSTTDLCTKTGKIWQQTTYPDGEGKDVLCYKSAKCYKEALQPDMNCLSGNCTGAAGFSCAECTFGILVSVNTRTWTCYE